MNEIFTIVGVAIITSGLAVLLKQYKPEYAFVIILVSGIFIFIVVIGFLREIFSLFNELTVLSGINGKNFEILLKCAGICLVTKTAAELCTDCGQSSIASKVEFAGKMIILASAVPLFSEIIEIIKEFIEL